MLLFEVLTTRRIVQRACFIRTDEDSGRACS